VQKKPLPQIH